jgi:hypothetical protein
MSTNNRLNLVVAFLTLLAGTGANQRSTRWSAAACERYAGMGRPRAQFAIQELMDGGLVQAANGSRPQAPHYRLAEPQDPRRPIFIPFDVLTGPAPSAIRRVRETGDALLLRMLIDFYGMIEHDMTFGISPTCLSHGSFTCTKVRDVGAATIWALHLAPGLDLPGRWTKLHSAGDPRKPSVSDRGPLLRRLNLLSPVAGLYFEPWVFDGPDTDAEPLFPVALPNWRPAPDAIKLTMSLRYVAAGALGDDAPLLNQYVDCVFVILPAYHQPPALRGVARFALEADTPARFLAADERAAAIEQWIMACEDCEPQQ